MVSGRRVAAGGKPNLSMAELTLFSYRHQNAGLHVLDARIKLAALAAVSIAAMQAGPYGLSIGSLLCAGIIRKGGFGLRRMIVELRYLVLFLILIWAVRGLTTPGQSIATIGFLSFSKTGLVSGALLSWRLLLIAILGLGLTATTPPSRIRAAIEWYLRPIPGIPHQMLGTMIGLLVRFIPVILSQSRDIMNAQRARAVENRKNPVYRMVRFGMPLLRHSFVTADRLVCAMEARNYTPHRTARPWRATAKDYRALAVIGGLCFVMVML